MSDVVKPYTAINLLITVIMGHRSWNDVSRLQYINCTESATYIVTDAFQNNGNKTKIIMVKIFKNIILIKNYYYYYYHYYYYN